MLQDNHAPYRYRKWKIGCFGARAYSSWNSRRPSWVQFTTVSIVKTSITSESSCTEVPLGREDPDPLQVLSTEAEQAQHCSQILSSTACTLGWQMFDTPCSTLTLIYIMHFWGVLHGMPHSRAFIVVQARWCSFGLPSDRVSLENGAVMMCSERWCLILCLNMGMTNVKR